MNLEKLSQIIKTKKLLIFDFDGTIADSLGIEFEIYSEYLKSINKTISHDDWEKLLKAHTAEGYIKFMNALFGMDLDYYEFKDKYAEFTKIVEARHPVKPYAWFKKAVNGFDKVKMVILSNKDEDLIRDNLVDWKMSEKFCAIYSCTTLRKTKEELYPQILSDFLLSGEDCVAFEDTECYLAAAKSLNIITVGVEHTNNKGELNSADYIIDTTK